MEWWVASVTFRGRSLRGFLMVYTKRWFDIFEKASEAPHVPHGCKWESQSLIHSILVSLMKLRVFWLRKSYSFCPFIFYWFDLQAKILSRCYLAEQNGFDSNSRTSHGRETVQKWLSILCSSLSNLVAGGLAPERPEKSLHRSPRLRELSQNHLCKKTSCDWN